MADLRTKQENILLQLQMILRTADSINDTLTKSIELVSDLDNTPSIQTLMSQGIQQLSTVLQLLGQLDPEDAQNRPVSSGYTTNHSDDDHEAPMIENGQFVYPNR